MTSPADRSQVLRECEQRSLSLLKSQLVSDRRDAVYILAEIGTVAVEELICALKDADYEVRSFATKALARTGRREAIPFLLEALRDKHWLVRANAVLALGDLKYLEGETTELDVLRNERHGFVMYAIEQVFPNAALAHSGSVLCFDNED